MTAHPQSPTRRFSAYLARQFLTEDSSSRKLPDFRVAFIVARRLWFLFFVMFCTIVMYAIISPLFQYVILTFFASYHGGGDCMVTPDSDPCRLAAGDLVTYNSTVGTLTSTVAVVSALTLGSLSDSIGRRKIFIVKAMLSLAMLYSLALSRLAGLTLWIFLVVRPLVAMWDFNGVVMALMADVIPERDMRGVAMSMTIFLVLVVALVCIGLAAVLPVSVSFWVAMIFGTIKIVFYFTMFPETLNEIPSQDAHQRRGPVGSLRAAYRIITSGSFISRMACIACIGALSSVGTTLIVQSYLTQYVGMKRQDFAGLFAVIIVAVLVVLGLFANLLTTNFGDVRTYQFSLFAVALLPAGLCLCKEPWQVMVLYGSLVGPVALQIPIVSAIKSNLVSDAQQGLVQGALTALVNIAGAIASPFFGWIYNVCTQGGAAPSRSAAFPPLLAASGVGLVAFFVSLSLPLKVPMPDPHSPRTALLQAEDQSE